MTNVSSPDGVTLWRSRATPEDAPTPWHLLLPLTVLGLLLRTVGLNGGLWWDEIDTLMSSVRAPLSTIVTAFPTNNQHTLFSLLAHVSITLFGEHPWSLRLPAVLLGVATIPILYFLAREFVGRAEAMLSCLLLGVAYHAVWFSTNARGYSMLACLTVASTWLLLRGLRSGRAREFVWYAIVASLGVYAHLTMVFLVVSHALLCAIPLGLSTTDAARWRRWRLPLLGFGLSALLTLMLYAPILLDVQQFFLQRPRAVQVATSTWAATAMWRGLQVGMGSLFTVVTVGALVALGLRSYYAQSKFLVGLFVLPGLITIGAAIGLHRPIFPRFLYFLVGFALLLVVRGAMELGRMLERHEPGDQSRLSRWGVMIVVLLAVAVALPLVKNSRYPKQDFAGAMRFVEAQRGPDEPVLTIDATVPVYRAYYLRSWPAITSLQQLKDLRSRGHRVWVVYTLPRYAAARRPDEMRLVLAECAVRGVFHGTLDDGDVTVCSMAPLPPASGG